MIEFIDDLTQEVVWLHYINKISTSPVTIIFSPLQLNQGSTSFRPLQINPKKMVGPSVLLPLLELRLKVPSFYLLCHVHWRRFLAMSCSLTSIICSRSINCFTKQGYMVASFGNAVWMNDVFQNLNFLFYIFKSF